MTINHWEVIRVEMLDNKCGYILIFCYILLTYSKALFSHVDSHLLKNKI